MVDFMKSDQLIIPKPFNLKKPDRMMKETQHKEKHQIIQNYSNYHIPVK